MKNKILLLILLSVAAFFALGAASFTEGPVYPWRVQSDISFNTDGTLKSAPVTTFFQADITDGTTTVTKSYGSVTWDAVANANKTVTVNGKTYTYGEVLSVVVAISQNERAAQGP